MPYIKTPIVDIQCHATENGLSRSTIVYKSGFTLVELLVVIGVLSVVTGTALLFLTSILRGSNQAGIVAEVKQNGQIVLDSIDRQIRNAQSARELTSIDGSVSTIELTLPGTSRIYLVCYDQDVVSSPKKNGWIGIDKEPAPVVSSDFLSITNKDTASGISIDCNSDSFNVLGNPADPYPQVVQVSFIAKQGVEAPGRIDFNASAAYKTTISLRKYSF